MKDSTKIFIASLIIFACSIGFFLGAFCFGNRLGCGPCPKRIACEQMYKGPHKFHHKDYFKDRRHDGHFREDFHRGDKFHGDRFRDDRDGDHKYGDFKDRKHFNKKFDFKKDIAHMDSVLQVTPEQKKALEQQRITMDSTFKELRRQKKEAEKSLRKALDSNDDQKISVAKANILKAQEALLNHRIDGVKGINKILTKEQQEKFKRMQEERKKSKNDK